MAVRAPGLTVDASKKRGPRPPPSPSRIEIIDTPLVQVVGTPSPQQAGRTVLDPRVLQGMKLTCLMHIY